MKITKMKATFGCLDDAVLELIDGINVFKLPNEGGKSTWTAFVTAMFYGLDPRRGAKGRPADKERFAPWNGKPMEGQLELSLQGRTIVLQRTSSKSKPFSQFRAWDKSTGLEIPELTGENCGRKLLGVERSVFCRSALLSGTELAVTQDEKLSARLSSLAASGRQDDSFLRAEERLKTWQNRLRYQNTGEIVQLQNKLYAMGADGEDAPQTAHLPDETVLLKMLGKLETGQAQVCPTALLGVGQEQIADKARRDLAKHKLFTAVFAALSAVALACSVFWLWCLAPAVLCLAILCLLVFGKSLPRAYGVEKNGQIMEAALRWRDGELRRWEQTLCMEQVRQFAPQVQTAQEAAEAVQTAIGLHRQAQLAQQSKPDEQELARLTMRLRELERREQAIILARQALRCANAELQKTYVPQLTKLAGEYLRSLSLGKYDGIIMDENMELSVRQTDSMVRPLAFLSKGAQDQTWLVLRLAMTKLLLPEQAFVVLDDALLTFDEGRERAAMEVFAREGRQVLIFSCR